MPLNAAWQETYEERAAILEYDALLPRKEAEAKARRLLGAPLPPQERNSPQYQAFRKSWHNKEKNNADQR